MTKWWAKLCFDKTWGLPQMAACQELLSVHCFHKKGSPAVCLFWATPVKVPRSPFGVWINCIKGHMYYLCFHCILAEGDCIRGTCVSTVSVSRLFVHFAIMARRVQWSFEEVYSGLLKESIASFERVYSFRRNIEPLSQCAFEVVYCTFLKGRIAGTCKYKRPRVW